jgi:hypothetical protein
MVEKFLPRAAPCVWGQNHVTHSLTVSFLPKFVLSAHYVWNKTDRFTGLKTPTRRPEIQEDKER